MNPLLDWAVFTFDEQQSRIRKYTNLDTSFNNLPSRGVVGVIQVFDDVITGIRDPYIIDPALNYIFVDSLQMWTGSDDENIVYRKSIGITLSAELKGLWIPDPWYAHVLKIIKADSDFPNALDRTSLSGEQQKRFDVAVIVAGREQDIRIEALETAIIDAGGTLPSVGTN